MVHENEVFDVVVVGAGPVGTTVAERVARAGPTVAVVEERLVGGECNYYGCVPSKAMLWPMEIAADVSRMPGLELGGPIDAAAVLDRREEFVSHFDDSGYVSGLNDLPAMFVRGRGRLSGPSEVAVRTPDGGTISLRAREAVVLATGSTPAIPGIPGLREARPWTNQEATSARQVPERLVVIGAGPVACEMAQALHALGAREVTMLVRGDRLLAQTEPFAGDLVAKSFAGLGIDVRFRHTAVRVERPIPKGPVSVHTDAGERIDADEILVAAGRRLAVDDLGLETVGVDADGPIIVDARMRATAVPDGWLYAVGDVNGRNLLTHMGKYQARVCADVITARSGGLEGDVADERGAPQVIFTDPQVCAVGLTEARARAAGFTVRTVEYDLAAVIGARLRADDYQGRAKLVVDEERRVLLGATFVGPSVVDLLHSATIAVTCEASLDQLRHAVPVFPTVSEIWLSLQTEYGL
ncbi:NAD(P)/FAD-dependent oxidoreductase [Nonomuraea sp. NPDC049421]|uniref:dihydrolipoyl dehydrogenase family protein n=1 Tax=Nonomuraea sp. NPDC049421 TaxID=3155275 RepID=UPI003427AAF3